MYKLVIQDDEGKTTVVPLIRDELTIGRKEGNTIRLTERNVSRSHARLTRSNGTVVIEDLGSYNGIRVNGSRIQGRATIAETDRVQIGDYLIEIRSAATAEAGAAPDETQPVERLAAANATAGAATAANNGAATNGAAVGDAIPAPTVSPLAADSGSLPAAAAATIPSFPAKAQEAVALADTDPGRAAATSVSNHGRLVVLSTNFPGQEFILEKSSMVVGRTDENDIWLNHRSISRHHAKVVLENGRYSIEDLQSSNGVRVNGEEYGKVELRRADVIDLGHVRLRFVEPGEDFVFGRDAQPVEVFPEGGNKLWLYLGLGALAIGGLIAAIVVMNSGGEETASGTAADGSGTGTAQAVVTIDASSQSGSGDGPGTAMVAVPIDAGQIVAVVADAAPATVDPDAEATAKKIQSLIVQANRQFKSRNWAKVVEMSNQIAALDEGNEAAKTLAKKAGAELEAQERLKQLQGIRNSRQFREIKRLADSLRGTSSQKAGQQIANRAQTRELIALRKIAVQASVAGDCDRVDRTARGAVFSANRSKLGAVKCEVAVEPDGDKDPPDTERSTEEAKKKLRQASKARTWGTVLKQCAALSALDALSGADRMKCAIAACNSSNRIKALQYRSSTPGQANKNRITQSCLTAGVSLD